MVRDPPHDDVEGAVNAKLVRTKENWARDGRALTGTTADPARDRLPPGQRLTRDFPVLEVTPDSVLAAFGGMIEAPMVDMIGIVEEQIRSGYAGMILLRAVRSGARNP